MSITTFPLAYIAALDLFDDQLADVADGFEAGIADGLKVGEKLPATWKLSAAVPFVQAAHDGGFPELYVVERQIVRVTVWHQTERQALTLAQIARGVLLDHSGPVIRNATPLTGPIPTTDPTNAAPTAYFTVEAVVRATT